MEVPAGLEDDYRRTAVGYLNILMCYCVVIVDCVTLSLFHRIVPSVPSYRLVHPPNGPRSNHNYA